jgi:hypothetical protein
MATTPDTTFSSNNVLTGSAALYIAPLGTALPTFDPTASDADTIAMGWVQIGYTNAGHTFEYSPTLKDINVDEALSPIAVLKTAEMLKITAALSEATLANLNYAISGANFTDVAAGAGVAEIATITVGGAALGTTAAFQYYMVMIVGKNPFGHKRYVIAYKAYSTAKVSMAFKKDSEIMIPVEFTGLADTTRSVGDQLFRITEKRANGS